MDNLGFQLIKSLQILVSKIQILLFSEVNNTKSIQIHINKITMSYDFVNKNLHCQFSLLQLQKWGHNNLGIDAPMQWNVLLASILQLFIALLLNNFEKVPFVQHFFKNKWPHYYHVELGVKKLVVMSPLLLPL